MGANNIGCPAKGSAAFPQGLDPVGFPANEDALELAQVFAVTRIRSFRGLQTTGHSVMGVICQHVGAIGVYLFHAGTSGGPRSGYDTKMCELSRGRHPGGN